MRFLLYLAGYGTTLVVPINQMFAAAVIADPAAIEIGYNENITVKIGMMDFETGDFMEAPDQRILTARYMNFDISEYPSGNEDYTWAVSFDPFTVNLKGGGLAVTNVTISLRSPPIAENAIQSGKLVILITDTWAYNNLYWPPDIPGFTSLFAKLGWFFSATVTMRFGQYSGKVLPEYHEVEVLVKVKPYHAARLETQPYVQLTPNEVASIPINIENIGNYNDTFNFRVVSEHKGITLSTPISVTLAPGEKKDTYLGVAIPPGFFDTGTYYNVKIEAFSIDEPNVTIAERTVILETKGLHVNEMSGSFLIFLLFIVILAYAFFSYRRRKTLEKNGVTKPDKPWEIPEEEKYLDRLKTRDKEKYQATLDMMHEEYQSALLWYNNYSDYVINKQKPKKQRKPKEKPKKEPKPKEKKEEKVQKLEEKPVEKPEVKTKEPEPTKVEKIKPKVEKKIVIEDQRKKRVMERIKREQEKQRKKLGDTNF